MIMIMNMIKNYHDDDQKPVEKTKSTDSGDLVVGEDEVGCGRWDPRRNFLKKIFHFFCFHQILKIARQRWWWRYLGGWVEEGFPWRKRGLVIASVLPATSFFRTTNQPKR